MHQVCWKACKTLCVADVGVLGCVCTHVRCQCQACHVSLYHISLLQLSTVTGVERGEGRGRGREGAEGGEGWPFTSSVKYKAMLMILCPMEESLTIHTDLP